MKRLIAIAAVMAMGAPAAAAGSPLIRLIYATPSSVKPGQKVRLHGAVACHNGDQVTLFSHAFKGSSQNFAGVPAVLTTVHAGRYSVTFRIHSGVGKRTYRISGRCGGGLFGTGSLKVT